MILYCDCIVIFERAFIRNGDAAGDDNVGIFLYAVFFILSNGHVLGDYNRLFCRLSAGVVFVFARTWIICVRLTRLLVCRVVLVEPCVVFDAAVRFCAG